MVLVAGVTPPPVGLAFGTPLPPVRSVLGLKGSIVAAKALGPDTAMTVAAIADATCAVSNIFRFTSLYSSCPNEALPTDDHFTNALCSVNDIVMAINKTVRRGQTFR
jgi:hypothetical protein